MSYEQITLKNFDGKDMCATFQVEYTMSQEAAGSDNNWSIKLGFEDVAIIDVEEMWIDDDGSSMRLDLVSCTGTATEYLKRNALRSEIIEKLVQKLF